MCCLGGLRGSAERVTRWLAAVVPMRVQYVDAVPCYEGSNYANGGYDDVIAVMTPARMPNPRMPLRTTIAAASHNNCRGLQLHCVDHAILVYAVLPAACSRFPSASAGGEVEEVSGATVAMLANMNCHPNRVNTAQAVIPITLREDGITAGTD
jgi:hypothetical protein